MPGVLSIQQTENRENSLKRAVRIFVYLLLFIIALQFVSAGFQHLGKNLADSILEATSNPFIGLFIGLLITAILQSSSTTTTMAVTLVASGSLPLTNAVPIVIGANIGTTLTSTLVSLSYITKKSEFVRAFSAGIVHDLFNICITLIIFPLELKYQLLSRYSRLLAQLFPISEGSFYIKGIDKLLQPVNLLMIEGIGGLLTICLGILLLFATVKLVSKLLYNQWLNRPKQEDTFLSNKMRSFGLGLIVTSIIQSSSLSTSMMVPLVATGKLSLKRAFSFIIGANLGTTVTALIAAIFQSEIALSLAIAHFIFNLVGCALFLSVPYLFKMITYISNQLGIITLRRRLVGITYVLLMFFIIPFGLIYFSKDRISNILAKEQSTLEIEKRGQ
jgi:sodium-dependent phosphate cotransporter